MKNIMTVIFILLTLYTTASSQFPNKISYQGLLTTASGPVNDGNYTLKFDVYNAPTSGTLRHSETFSGVNIQQGTFSVKLGSNVPLPAIFSESLYVEITATAGPSGLTYPLVFSPRAELTASPYSLAPWATSGSNVYYNGGGVGIGTTSPLTPLHVEGSGITLSRAGYGNPFSIVKDGNAPFSIFEGGTANQYRLAMNNDGKIGIGTVNPNARLELKSPIEGEVMRFGYSNDDYHFLSVGYHGEQPQYNYLGFNIEYNSNDIRRVMTLQGDGKMGIGTSTPDQTLSVNGMLGLTSTTWVAPTTRGLFLYHGGSGAGIYAYNYPGGDGDPIYIAGKSLTFHTYINGYEQPRLSITNGGFVGIGTAYPFSQFYIEATGKGSLGGVCINNSAEGGRMITINQQTPGQLTFTSIMGAIDLLTLDYPNERVGIGTTSPSYKLHVSGDIGAQGLVYSYGVPLTSDQRFKKDILAFPNALEKVQAMRGVAFHWRTDEFPDKNFSKESQIGFIAQEVENVIPEIVSVTPDGNKAVDYSKLTPVLVEAIKEQQKEIDELKALVKSLIEAGNK